MKECPYFLNILQHFDFIQYKLQDRNLDWFPRLRAMSLAADESEGEQMELRSLQAQLEITQTLVQHLSQQLTELRDQVL